MSERKDEYSLGHGDGPPEEPCQHTPLMCLSIHDPERETVKRDGETHWVRTSCDCCGERTIKYPLGGG